MLFLKKLGSKCLNLLMHYTLLSALKSIDYTLNKLKIVERKLPYAISSLNFLKKVLNNKEKRNYTLVNYLSIYFMVEIVFVTLGWPTLQIGAIFSALYFERYYGLALYVLIASNLKYIARLLNKKNPNVYGPDFLAALGLDQTNNYTKSFWILSLMVIQLFVGLILFDVIFVSELKSYLLSAIEAANAIHAEEYVKTQEFCRKFDFDCKQLEHFNLEPIYSRRGIKSIANFSMFDQSHFLYQSVLKFF